jgi:DNA polymerase (family 10)
MDLRVVTDAQFPYALHHFTGSKAHNIAMRGRAVRMGIKINEYGLFRGTEIIPCADEAAVFAALGLQFVPPELREDQGEIEAAERGDIPQALLAASDLRGAFHVHTTYSDGQDSPQDVVRAARDLGWEYVGLSDHSRSATPGMSVEKALEQLELLERLAASERGIRVFRGVESDILPDGSLDYPPEILAKFDFVIASVHTELGLARDTQTRRVLRAVENPFTSILGHPTSRLLFDQPPMDLDLGAVFEAAARCGVAVEINGQPKRMDPDGALIRLARDHGAMLCVDPDAHRIRSLRNVEFGVGLARRGWVEKHQVLNAWDAKRVAAHLQERRARAVGV